MNPSEVEWSIKKLLFSEPRFSEYLEECSRKVCSPFESWVNDDSDEYIKYLNTRATVEDDRNENQKKVMRDMNDCRDKTLLTYLTKCFENRSPSFIDMDILVEDSVFKVHRLIVAAFVPTIREDLSKIPEQSQANGVIVDLKGICKRNAVECLIEYMYTGKVKPTSDNFLDVLELSINCRMQNFTEKWVEAFDSTKPLRALKLLFRCRLARRYRWTEYVVRLNKALALEFENLMLTDKFLRLTANELCAILREDEIGTSNEVVVFLGALKWLNHDWNNRNKCAVEIMKEIRFHQMNKDELQACLSPPISRELMTTNEIMTMITDALYNRIEYRRRQKMRVYRKAGAPNLKLWINKMNGSKQLINETEELRNNLDSKKTKPLGLDAFGRKQWTAGDESKSRNILGQEIASPKFSSDRETLRFVVSGSSTESKPEETRTNVEFKIDFKGEDVENTPIPVKEVTKEVPKTAVEQISSEEKQKREDSVSSVTPNHDTKTSPQAVTTIRKHILPEATVSLIVFGDSSDSTETAFVFRCDHMSLKKWKKQSALPNNPNIPLDPMIVCDSKNIYCVGGIEKTNRKDKRTQLLACNKFYKYDLKENKLLQLEDMNYCRVQHSAVFLNGRLYVVGGRSKKEIVLNTIEFYDFHQEEWQITNTVMHTPRFGCACAAIKKRLFIFGGITKVKKTVTYQLLSDVAVYNPFTNIWSKMTEPLPVPVAYCSVVYHNDMIYVIGGRVKIPGAAKLTMSGKVYRFNQTKWEELKPLKNPRCHMFCFAHKTTLFAIGGCTDKEVRVNICETLDTNAIEKGWTVIDKLPFETTGNMMTTIRTDAIGQ